MGAEGGGQRPATGPAAFTALLALAALAAAPVPAAGSPQGAVLEVRVFDQVVVVLKGPCVPPPDAAAALSEALGVSVDAEKLEASRGQPCKYVYRLSLGELEDRGYTLRVGLEPLEPLFGRVEVRVEHAKALEVAVEASPSRVVVEIVGVNYAVLLALLPPLLLGSLGPPLVARALAARAAREARSRGLNAGGLSVESLVGLLEEVGGGRWEALAAAVRAGSSREVPERLARAVSRACSGCFSSVTVVDADTPMAMAVGLRGRRLIVTRGLLDLLDDSELEAVVAHEAAHRRRWHAAVSLAASAAALASAAAAFHYLMVRVVEPALGDASLAARLLAGAMLFAALLAASLTLTSKLSRHLESRADRAALSHIQAGPGDPGKYLLALAKIAIASLELREVKGEGRGGPPRPSVPLLKPPSPEGEDPLPGEGGRALQGRGRAPHSSGRGPGGRVA